MDPSPEAPSQVLELLNTFLTMQALHAAAVLGLADMLAGGSVTMEALVASTGAHGQSPYRLLRMLTGTGVVREESDGRFSLTPLGEPLRSDVLGSVPDWAARRGPGAVGRVGTPPRRRDVGHYRLRARRRCTDLRVPRPAPRGWGGPSIGG